MRRNNPNWTVKRIKPAAKEMTKVVIVVPSFPCADPAAPLSVPLRMLVMSDIVLFKAALRLAYCFVSRTGPEMQHDARDDELLLLGITM